MLQAKTQWKYRTYEQSHVQQLQESLGITPLLAQFLAARGVENPETAKLLMYPDKEVFHDPFLLDGMHEAVIRIEIALDKQQSIVIYGDYDCDGVSSTAIMLRGLRDLGANVSYFIPDRFTDGYGLNEGAVQQICDRGAELVITVDTGISAKDEIAFAQKQGLDVIVTDHHEPPEDLPECLAVINPKKPGCSYPFKQLCGSGVALKLIHALTQQVPKSLLDLCCLGTIADLMPLIDENRSIVRLGLKRMNSDTHQGLQALLSSCGLEDQVINEQHVGFSLAPRVNASGRLARADLAVELLITDDYQEARKQAQELDSLNDERKALVQHTSNEADKWIEQHYGDKQPSVLVLAQHRWHEGILGIVAARLVEKMGIPCIVLTIDEQSGIAKGSARSIEAFDMHQALNQCKQWLTRFGGHPMAAGMSLKAENIKPFRQHLEQIAQGILSDQDLRPVSWVDVVGSLDEINIKALEEIQMLAPFGIGHPKPIFSFEKQPFSQLKTVGAEGQHLKCTLGLERSESLDSIGFHWGEVATRISPHAKIDIIGDLAINEWNGARKPQLFIKDLQVCERQFFDWRGRKGPPSSKEIGGHCLSPILCVFHDQPTAELNWPEPFRLISFDTEGNPKSFSSDKESMIMEQNMIVLYDLPRSLNQLEQASQHLSQAQQIWMCFFYDDEHFFSIEPRREHFRLFYGYLKGQESFHLQRDGQRLAKLKGWTMEFVTFMTEVFVELGFITREHDILRTLDQPIKKELHESPLFQQKGELMDVQNTLLYANYDQVRKLLQGYWGKSK